MYSLVNLIIALIVGGAIGGLIGWYSALASRGDNKRKIILELESQLDQARQNKVDYEAEVTEHFARTADLLNKLTDDYRSVYTHLANGADQLCGDQSQYVRTRARSASRRCNRQASSRRGGSAPRLRAEKA